MGSTLTNGIYLPAEGERNCYTGLAANWSALDGLIGGYNAHIGNTTIHVTAEDKEAWNGKADASALTAHTGDTTIHVTSADKSKWDAVTSKADDSDVVHKSGNETVNGKKIFSNDLTIYNNDSSQSTKNLNISSSKIQVGDTSNSDAFGIRFNAGASYVAQILAVNDTTGTQNLQLSIRTKDGSDNYITSMVRSRVATNGNSSFEPGANNSTSLGSSSFRWRDVQTNQINGLEPSSLSLPSGKANNVIDISSYITNLDGTANSYTVPANGWISIAVVGTAIDIVSSSWSDSRLRASSGNVRMLYPVLKNEILDILVTGTTLAYARFIPCQGNI